MQRFVCDGQKDCDNGADEEVSRCKESVCNANKFNCDTDVCLAWKFVCDGKQDCQDATDEAPASCLQV